MFKFFARFFFIINFSILIFFQAKSQNISGEKIQVSAESLSVLKFNSKITHFEFDDKVNYSGQVRTNDNSLVIRTIGDHPDTTNLYVTEGKRGHWFIIIFLQTIDVNNTKLYYDYSDLKNLKKVVAQEQQDQANALAAANANASSQIPVNNTTASATTTNTAPQNTGETDAQKARINAMIIKATADSIAAQKAEDAQIAKAAADAKKQKAIDDAKRQQFVTDSINAKNASDAKLAQQRADSIQAKEIADAKRSQFVTDSIAAKKAEDAQALQAATDAANAKKAEDARLAKAAADAQKQKAIDDARLAQAKTDSINAKNAADARLAKARLDSIRIKKAEDARLAQMQADSIKAQKILAAKIAQHISDSIQTQKIIAAKIAQHIADSTQAKQIADAKIAKAAELAKQQELARVAAIEKKRIADSIAAIPKVYTHLDLWKKYPTIVFENPPPGQSLASDYFLTDDTAENSRVSNLILNNLVANDTLETTMVSDTDQNTNFTLKSIDFSGVNCYMQLIISNKSKQDYLVGQINLKWYQANGGPAYNLYPCYLTAFPVLSPGAERTIMLVTRAVNIKDNDHLILTLGDRLGEISLEMSIPGTLYNQQMAITRKIVE
jgi:hypothetical protein